MLCGTLFGLPFLLLHNDMTHASHGTATALAALPSQKGVVYPSSERDRVNSVNLRSHLVAYESPQSTTSTTALPTTTTSDPPAPSPTTTTTAPPPPPPPTTTTTAPPAPADPANQEVGEATWYSEAAAGMCASPTLPFGTVLTVTNNATGASTQCTVDDRESAGYPRVVDMSYSGFSEIADPNQGVVQVTISW
jgi:rare lipoprotein A (peptidoglycan hydrolase)